MAASKKNASKPKKASSARKGGTVSKKRPPKSPRITTQDTSRGRPITPPLPKKKEEEEEVLPTKEPVVSSVKGMRDLLPLAQREWQEARGVCESIAHAFGYLRIDTPLVEKTELFVRGVGKTTDIVEKEMFTFTDQGKTSLTLVPEGTAGTARAFVENGLHTMPQPLKVYKLGSKFRRERPQAGRYREFYQFDMDVLGSEQAAVDAEVMFMAYKTLKRLGLGDKVMFQVNSLGDAEERKAYRDALVAYYNSKKRHLSETDKKRLRKNPLRLLDSKDPGAMKLAEDAPHMVDYLGDDSNKHFTLVLEYLDEMGVPYALNPKIVRGLDYYNRTVFEVTYGDPNAEGHEHVIASGGRYDGLIKEMGGHDTPAVGVSLGLDRVVAAMIAEGGKNQDDGYYKRRKTDVFFAQLGELSKKRMMPMLEELVDKGLNCAFSMSKDSLRSQLRLADKYGARLTLILGQKEALEDAILVRDMISGIQELIPTTDFVAEVKRRVAAKPVKTDSAVAAARSSAGSKQAAKAQSSRAKKAADGKAAAKAKAKAKGKKEPASFKKRGKGKKKK